jgi:chitinase
LWLTAALPGTEHDFNKFELKPLSRSMNDLAIMAYDMASASDPTTGFASALFRDPANPAPNNNNAAYAIDAFLRAGVPAKKIVLGVPFGGGRHWAGVPATNHGLYQTVPPPAANRGAATTPANATNAANATGAASASNTAPARGGIDSLPPEADRQYWSSAGTCSVWYNNNFWSYDCPQAVSAKMSYIRAHHLGGVMFWELSHDPTGDLLHALSAPAPSGPKK